MQRPRTQRFGLLGRTLGHSWSPKIHSLLGSVPYELIELEPTELEAFIRSQEWQGLNVTIPYKREAARLADVCSAQVQRLGVANTLVHQKDGRIFAENTDVAGFAYMLERFCLRELGKPAKEALSGEKLLVLGTGGAAQAVCAAMQDCGAHLVCISRQGNECYEGLAERHPEARLIVNTTPVGMYPHCPASPLDEGVLGRLPQLAGVLDVVYNPLRTGILMQAERLGIPCENGLAMLVAQAFYASQLFQDTSLDTGIIEAIEHTLQSFNQNIALIGMPGVGKTTSGRALARLLDRPFVDLDDIFLLEQGMHASEYIQAYGEQEFRRRETEVCALYGGRSGLVIACGGGVVTREENYELLHQNASIVLLERPIDELATSNRPLSQSHGVEELARQRMPLYRAWADHTISCSGSADADARMIAALLGL